MVELLDCFFELRIEPVEGGSNDWLGGKLLYYMNHVVNVLAVVVVYAPSRSFI
jgi:hypothetical protein